MVKNIHNVYNEVPVITSENDGSIDLVTTGFPSISFKVVTFKYPKSQLEVHGHNIGLFINNTIIK